MYKYEDSYLISQLVCAKLCHDVLTPVGAMVTGLDLLKENMESSDSHTILSLINASAQSAAKKLIFFRLCMGYISNDAPIALSQVGNALRELCDPNKHTVQWDLPRDFMYDHPQLELWVRMAAIIGYWVLDCAPYGGRLTVSNAGAGISWTITAASLAINNELIEIMENGTKLSQVTPRTVLSFTTWSLARQIGVSTKIKGRTTTTMTIEAS